MTAIKGLSLLVVAMMFVLLVGCGGDNTATNTPVASQPTPSSGGSGGGTGNTNVGNAGAYADLQVTTSANYSSSLGLYYYIGVVKNTGSQTAKQIKVTLLDDSGNAVAEGKAAEADLVRVILPPGKSAGFSVQYDQQVNRPGYKLSAQTVGASDSLQPAQLSVVNDKLGAGDTPKSQKITGEIKNDSDKDVVLWAVNVMAYDASGNLVEVTSGASVQNAAAQGGFKAHGSLPFEANLGTGSPYGNKGATVAKYDLFVSGYQNPVTQ